MSVVVVIVFLKWYINHDSTQQIWKWKIQYNHMHIMNYISWYLHMQCSHFHITKIIMTLNWYYSISWNCIHGSSNISIWFAGAKPWPKNDNFESVATAGPGNCELPTGVVACCSTVRRNCSRALWTTNARNAMIITSCQSKYTNLMIEQVRLVIGEKSYRVTQPIKSESAVLISMC